MPDKTCIVCNEIYFARWRNTPAVCETCALFAIMCPACWKITLYADPAQLALFTSEQLELTPTTWRPLSTLVGDHFSNQLPRNLELETSLAPWPRQTSQAERMKYPYH